MKYCKECGTTNRNNAIECTECGCDEFEFECERCGTVFENADKCPKCGLRAGRRKQICPECGEEYFTATCPECGYSKNDGVRGVKKSKSGSNSSKKKASSKKGGISVCGLIGTILGAVGVILCFIGLGSLFGIPALALGGIGLAAGRKRGKSKALPIVAIILGSVGIIISMLFTAACKAVSDELSGPKQSVVSVSDSQKNGDSQASVTTYGIGQRAELGGVAATLTKVEENKGNTFMKPTDGNVFVLCEFEIENNSNKDAAISSVMCFEAYCDGYATQLSLSATVSKDGSQNQLDGTIAPGKRLKGVVGYEVSSNWGEIEIQFKPGLLSDKLVFVAKH